MQLLKNRNDVPTWGSPYEQRLHHRQYYDPEWHRISWMDKRKGVHHIVLPQEDAKVFEGVIQIYDRVEKLAWESSDSYFVLARKYVGLVLDQVIMAYVMGEQQQFMGFTASLETLWRSSNYGMDIMHLSRGAKYIKGAAMSSNEYEFTEQPNKLALSPLQLLPPLPAEFSHLAGASS